MKSYSRMLALFLMAIGSLALVTGCQTTGTSHHHGGKSHLKPHYEGSLFTLSKNKTYSVEMRLKDGPLRVGRNRADIIIHADDQGKSRDVEKARVTITPWMPMHNHGVPIDPVVQERGGGLYTIDNIDAIMEGLWELRIAISSKYGDDTAVFEFEDVKKDHAKTGHQGHAHMDKMSMKDGLNAPEGTDLSAKKMSIRHLYSLSYESLVSPMPINRIHTWKLMIKDRQGVPVSGALVKIDGDMPAHGHGLPTRPEVSAGDKPGLYLVEGMKFNMPGHWVINFYLTKGKETDTVSFDLEVR